MLTGRRDPFLAARMRGGSRASGYEYQGMANSARRDASGTHGDYRQMVKSAAADESTFLRLTLSKPLREDASLWVKVVVRPVLVRGRRRMQFSYFDARRDVTKNYSLDELDERLDCVLEIPFGSIHVQTTSGDIRVRITRKGEAVVTRTSPSRSERKPELSHDREKPYLLRSAEVLSALGITDAQGKVRPGMQAKHRQVNEFLRVVRQTIPPLAPPDRPLRIADCGCGSAYLTFAAYSYLTGECGLAVEIVGIDLRNELIERNIRLRDLLGFEGMRFEASSILSYSPPEPPDVVLSLHACDTATDEAIARGVLWGSRAILAAPCCQHELNDQLRAPLFRPVLRHGILRERLADILTDAFRALALQIVGYRTDVIEFVDPEHTAKNLMIRAESGAKPGRSSLVRQYADLKSYWDVTPSIEGMLGESIGRFL